MGGKKNEARDGDARGCAHDFQAPATPATLGLALKQRLEATRKWRIPLAYFLNQLEAGAKLSRKGAFR